MKEKKSMPHKRNNAGTPEDWLRYAYSDLELARVTPPPNVILEALCFHAQQTVEKAFKAVLVKKGIPIPKSHSIRMLLDLLSKEIEIPEEIEEAAILTDYAVISRYPGDVEPVDELEYQEAVQIAQNVFRWAGKMIQEK
jgi:HEPN domain-containing protein